MKSFFLFLCLLPLITVTDLRSQTPTERWQSAEFVKTNNLKSPRIIVDGLSNVYMITTQVDENPFGGFTLAKYDSLGTQLWQRNHPIEIIGHIYGGLVVDSLGYSYVSLLFNGSDASYDADTKVIKYAPDGTKIWESAAYRDGHGGDNYIYHLGADSLGRLFALGVNESQVSEAEQFLFISEIDTADGSERWRSTFPGLHWLQGIRVWNTNRIEVLATRYADGLQYYDIIQLDKQGQLLQHSTTPYSGYTLDFHLISRSGNVITGNRGFGYTTTKLSPEGDTIWRYALPEGIPGDKVLGIVEDDSFNVYVTGAWNDENFNRQILTSKFSKEGELVWQRSYDYLDTILFDGGQNIELADSLVYVIGSSQTEEGEILLTILVYDKWSGEERYIINLERGLTFAGQQILVKGNKFFYTGVSHMNTGMSSEIVTGCFEMPEVVSSSTAPEVPEVDVFPNPFAQELTIRNIDLQVFQSLELYDMAGRLLLRRAISSAQEQLVLEGTGYRGALTLVLRGKGVALSKKIIGH